jgi:hypothetical protein
MFELITNQTWRLLCAIPDRAFQRALLRPEFSRDGLNGREINVYWLYPWALSDECGNPRYSATAVAVRDAWPAHTRYNIGFLQEARQLRYA